MEPLGPDVRRELGRFGPQAGMAEVLAAWPAAVGPAIAKNAWPARISRDGTLHVATRDAIWAFELGHRAAEIAQALGVPAVRFSAGKIPDSVPGEATEPTPKQRLEPTDEQRRQAAETAAVIEDEELRAVVARAVAASLARHPSDRPF
jgi:hypothetical protein